MHLGLIGGPFVPHNLVINSGQESPVPLPKFQMAPRLKILMASGSRKEPRYTFTVSQNSRQMNPLQVPQQGLYKKRGPSTGHFASLSKPHLSGSPVQESSFKVPLMESLAERYPTTTALILIILGPRKEPSLCWLYWSQWITDIRILLYCIGEAVQLYPGHVVQPSFLLKLWLFRIMTVKWEVATNVSEEILSLKM
jgi:hypothetical protein